MKRFLSVVLLLACLPWLAPALAQDEKGYRMQERFAVDYQYHVRMRVELSGSLTPPAAKGKTARTVKVEGASSIDYHERILALDERGRVGRTLRSCEKLDFRRTIAGQPQELSLRSGVRRLVVLRKGHTEVPFSPDGPLTWGEIDAVRTDVFTPALAGLLPDRDVRVGDRWSASSVAVQELTDLEKIDEGSLECKLERLENVGKRRLLRVTYTGTVRGVGEDGPVRHRLLGHFHYDLEGRYLADVTLQGTTTLLDGDGKEVGRIEGRFVLVRTVGTRARELGDESIRGLKLEPDDDNTQMLYDNRELGLRFLHSRRWRVAQVMGAQVALATNEGNGILITVDPSDRVPSASAFQEESRTWLVKQKAKVVRSYSPRRLRDRPTLDGFAFEIEMGKQKAWLDYYVTAQSGGGATIAGRLVPDGLAELRRDVDRIARSVTITRTITRIIPPPKKK